MRNFMATHNQIAVSANKKETAVNKEQVLDTTIPFAIGDVIDLEPRRESNENETTGYEEPDVIYDLGKKAKASLNAEKAQPQHFALLMAYALGAVSTGAAGTGYEHTITPIDGEEDDDRSIPSLTMAQRYGKSVVKRRFASLFVNGLTATFARDEWCKIVGELVGTGKVTKDVIEETINAAENSTELNLALNKVAGATAAAQLNNVHRIRVALATGVWTEVAYSAVAGPTAPSDWAATTAYSLDDKCKPTTLNDYWYICVDDGSSGASEPTWPTTIGERVTDGTVTWECFADDSPSVITITAPAAGATLRDYKVLYIPAEWPPTDWLASTAYVADDLCKPITANGYWYKCVTAGTSDASEPTWPTTIGGTVVDGTVTWECIPDEWMTFPAKVSETPLRVAELTLKLGGTWNGSAFQGGREMDAELKSIEWTFSNNGEVQFVPGAGDAYAARYSREGRTQTIKVDREFREYILQQHIDDNDTFGVYILAEGAVYDDPHKYQVELIFPSVAVLTAPLAVDGKRMGEAGDLQVLEDDTYGSVIANVKNLQATYAA